ncbi:hypothetical protein [Mesorhizobium escarrei]|uniref:Uncharacterized protein n=1 Tax=Mesorhizobium escarrei TaxID=666018 RepID=A0ABM9ECM6_9HYPH|nr:hypothetical protein [Mesorhizobium escarrei]CAH2407054.1 conserved hypothetical protein [Mesorhizobium escarrei]
MSESKLDTIYKVLSDWTDFETADALVHGYFAGDRTAQEVQRFRARQIPFKKLSDEVVPAMKYLREIGFKGSLRFPFDNSTPDCWIRTNDGEVRGIEVTLAKARERVALAKELNETGSGRGYLGLSDEAPQKEFEAKLAGKRAMYTTEAALSSIGAAIKSCLSKKTHSRYAGFDLVIDAPLRTLPADRWKLIEPDLSAAAEPTTFHRVYVVGNSELRSGFYIKVLP